MTDLTEGRRLLAELCELHIEAATQVWVRTTLVAALAHALPALLDAAEERDRLREALVELKRAVNHPLMAGDIGKASRAAINDHIDAALAPRKGERDG